MHQIKKSWNKYYDYIMIIVIYGLLHVFIHTDCWDDFHMSQRLKQYDYNLIAFLAHSWNTGGSFLFLKIVEVTIEALPNYIWKILDVIMIEITYHYFVQTVKLLSENSQETIFSTRLWMLLFFFSFPFSLFATAGWMTTTIAYAWTFSAFFYSLYIFLLSSQKPEGGGINLLTYIIYGITVLYAANCNLLSFSMFIIFHFVYITCQTKSKAFKILFAEGIISSILNMIMFIVCPGNRIRNMNDAQWHNTAELLNLSIGGHLRMGINSTFYHFISVPNVILFTLCLTLIVCSFYKTKNKFYRIISCVPMFIDVFWTGYLFFTRTIPNRILTYIYPDALFEVCSKSEQFCTLISALLIVLFICYLVGYLTDFSCLSWFMIGILLFLGLFPCVAIGFTATVSASVMRIATFFYFSIMLCVCILVMYYDILKNKIMKYMFCTVGWIGALFNILQIIRHIIVYG